MTTAEDANSETGQVLSNQNKRALLLMKVGRRKVRLYTKERVDLATI